MNRVRPGQDIGVPRAATPRQVVWNCSPVSYLRKTRNCFSLHDGAAWKPLTPTTLVIRAPTAFSFTFGAPEEAGDALNGQCLVGGGGHQWAVRRSDGSHGSGDCRSPPGSLLQTSRVSVSVPSPNVLLDYRDELWGASTYNAMPQSISRCGANGDV